jgi:hypothetical protein
MKACMIYTFILFIYFSYFSYSINRSYLPLLFLFPVPQIDNVLCSGRYFNIFITVLHHSVQPLVSVQKVLLNDFLLVSQFTVN